MFLNYVFIWNGLIDLPNLQVQKNDGGIDVLLGSCHLQDIRILLKSKN